MRSSQHNWFTVVLAILSTINVPGQSNPGPKTAATPTPPPHPELKRWIDIDAFALSTRYRLVKAANHRTLGNQNQFQVAARGRFKFDRKGRYSVNAGLFTGNSFTGGWNSTGWGTGDLQTNLYVKQLYLSAKPVEGLEVQFGGIAFNNGVHTEITGYDNDAYLTGERVAIRRPKDLYFDEVSITYGFIGDLVHPSVFSRFKHLNKSNYHQILVRKQVHKRVNVSADYTFESGRDILRQAIRGKVPELRVVDTLLFENYERVSPDVGYGFNIAGEKTVTKKLSLTGGFARIDRVQFNADRFPPGKRIYFGGAYKLNPEFSVSGIVIEGLGHLPAPLTPRTRIDIILTYNFLETLHRLRVF
jgi:hypothetical protein